jgi:hypothetical protein
MSVVCAIPIQIPVHRVRVTARCLATGGPLHTAALRLADYWGESPEEIAEVLGLSIPRTETLLADLQRGGEPIEREFVLWVDHARGNVLPYSALSGVAIKPSPAGPFTLPVDPPTPNRLSGMGLDAGLSWDLGLEGHVEVLEVTDAVADVRQSRALPHVLRLPETELMIYDSEEWSILQHGIVDPQITSWARANYTEDVQELIATAQPYALPDTPRQLTGGATTGSDGQWETLDPHPKKLRRQIADASERAHERIVLSAPDLRIVPAWMQETLTNASERDVEIVLCPHKPELAPRHMSCPFTTSPAPHAPQALTVLCDEKYAVLHTDPAASLGRRAQPKHQDLHTTNHEGAIGALLRKLGLTRLRPPAPRRPLAPKTIANMLTSALGRLQAELPKTLTAQIQPGDERFALETIDRQRDPENPTTAARRAAAGIAWERTLSTLAYHLATEHEQLQVLAERYKPPHARIDLDLLIADEQNGIVWVIDAKNADPTNDQLSKMQAQLRLLKQAPDLTGGRPAIGVIVHRKGQLDPSPQPTEHHDILRSTLQRLPDLLLAKRLPGAPAGTPRSHTPAA